MSGFLHFLLKWWERFLIFGIIFLFAAWMTLPVLRELVTTLFQVFIAVWRDIALPLIQQIGDLIRNTDLTP